MIKGKSGKMRQMTVHSTPAKTRNYEHLIQSYAAEAMEVCGAEITRQPIHLKIFAEFPVTDSWPQWKKTLAHRGGLKHTGKPDVDNIVKAVKDACNSVIWHDDSQVFTCHAVKKFGDRPGVLVVAEVLSTAYPSQIKKKSDVVELAS